MSNIHQFPPQKPRTIDCTPAWVAVLPIYLEAYKNASSAEVREAAFDELTTMARLADLYNAGV